MNILFTLKYTLLSKSYLHFGIVQKFHLMILCINVSFYKICKAPLPALAKAYCLSIIDFSFKHLHLKW